MSALASLQSETRKLDRISSGLSAAMTAMKAREAELRARADECIAAAIERGAELYDRERDLAELFPRSKWEGKSDGEIIDMLRRAVNAGSKAIARGAWFADGNRQMALRQALRAEEQR